MGAEGAGRSRFQWENLGDMATARPNLGPTTNILVYRLMQYTLRDVLTERYGSDEASRIVREAGQLAGEEFCRNLLDTTLPFNPFVALLQERLKTLGIGILRIEKSDAQAMEFVLTVSEDLDCSGLPIIGETVCEYDEGFIAGIFSVYTGRPFTAREIDCWATGERTCRFLTKPAGEETP
ncbi:MAG: 4-vinyl reductase [Geobacter sp.]|nr:4-vinyl reductase [Geobacter sp.]